MVRRTAIVGAVPFAAMAGQALAATARHTQMTDGSATASRTASSGVFDAGSLSGSLRVACCTGGMATLRYAFASSRAVMGTVAGLESAVLSSVGVGYHTR